MIVATWVNMGGTVLIYLAALQSIPGELYEAAELDGAGLWRRIRHVTIPQTRFIILMLMLLQIVATMQVFTEPFLHHRRRAGELHRHRPLPDLPVRLPLQRLRRRLRPGRDAARCVLAAFSALYLRLTRTDWRSGA